MDNGEDFAVVLAWLVGALLLAFLELCIAALLCCKF